MLRRRSKSVTSDGAAQQSLPSAAQQSLPSAAQQPNSHSLLQPNIPTVTLFCSPTEHIYGSMAQSGGSGKVKLHSSPARIRSASLRYLLKEPVGKIVNWIMDAASCIHTEEINLVELKRTIEESLKEFKAASVAIQNQLIQIEAASQVLKNLNIQQQMAEQVEEKDEIVQVQDDANSQMIQTDDYVELIGEIDRKEEFADVRVGNQVARKIRKGRDIIPLVCSWVNFLVDITYSMVQLSANNTFLMVLSIFLTVLPSVTFYFEVYRLKNHFNDLSPKRKIAHDIFLGLHPGFGRRSTALVVSSCIASFLVVGSAYVKVLSYFLPPISNLFVVIGAVIAFVQVLIISITALGGFENPRLVCVSSEKVQMLTKVEGLVPPVYYCNCPTCSSIQASSDDL